jgi:hypothetical protein
MLPVLIRSNINQVFKSEICLVWLILALIAAGYCLVRWPLGIPIIYSVSSHQLAACQKQVRQCCQNLDLAAVLAHAPQPGLLKAKLLLWPPAGFA